MSPLLEALEHICSPLQLITGLGINPEVHGGRHVAGCPACGETLHILPTGFLCAGRSCSFRAGGIYDLARGGGTYSDAVDKVAAMFQDRFEDLGFSEDSGTMVRLAGALSTRRAVYDFFRELGVAPTVDHAGSSARNDLRRAASIDPSEVSFCAFPSTPDQADRLSDIISPYSAGQVSGQRPVLLPYFSNHHTVSVLAYLPRVGARHRYIKLKPSKFQFCGLMQAQPDTSDYILSLSYAHMLRKNAEFCHTDPGKLALHLLYDPSAATRSWVPESCSATGHKGGQWAPLVMLSRETDVRMPGGATVVSHLMDDLEEELKAAGLTPRAEILLEQLQLFDNAAAELQDRLRKARRMDLLGTVRRQISTRILDVTPGGLKLVSREDGYYTSSQNHERRLTNFTVSLKEAVRFADSRDVFYSADVSFGGRSHRALLPADALDTGRKLRSAVQALPTGQEGMPVMTETTGAGASLLMRYLSGRPADIPALEGVASLGWGYDRSVFYGPSWIADGEGVRHARQVHHPDSPVLKNFDPEPPLPGNVEGMPLEVSDLIAQAVAMVFRSFHGVPAMSVAVARSPEAESTLKSLFAGLGQQAPFHYSDSQWRRGQGLPGFPVYGTGATYWQASTLKQPVFLLAERGLRLTCEPPPSAGPTFRATLLACVEWMLSGESTFVPGRSVDPACVLGKEGRRVIAEATGGKWEVREPYYRALDTVLGGLPFERAKDYLTFDINRRSIELKLAGLPEVDGTDLELELGRLASGVRKTDAGVAANDADMGALLETYYQDRPAMEEVFVTPSDS